MSFVDSLVGGHELPVIFRPVQYVLAPILKNDSCTTQERLTASQGRRRHVGKIVSSCTSFNSDSQSGSQSGSEEVRTRPISIAGRPFAATNIRTRYVRVDHVCFLDSVDRSCAISNRLIDTWATNHSFVTSLTYFSHSL